MSICSESSVSSEIYSVVLMYPLQIEIVCVLHHRHKVAISELAVLTPYSAQKEKIKKMAQEKTGDMKNLRVASIIGSQGKVMLYY